MGLATGRGPLSSNPAGRFSPAIPTGAVLIEPHLRRIQALVDGEVVLDTEQAMIVHRPDRTLTYAFLPEVVGDLPHEPEPEAAGYVTVPWDAVDEWREEGRVLVHYPPNPYHRIDCRPTRRRLRVEVAGTVLVDTDDTTIVFETALAPVLYVAPAHVRTDLLRPSATTSYCNYKGWAAYWSADIDGEIVEDVAWTYDDPLPESTPLAGYFCFDPTKADVQAAVPPGYDGPACAC